MSLESFPPLMLVCLRYLLSGSIMLLFAKARGLYLPRGRELAAACFSGFLTLGIGNGALVFSEVLIPSGIAGLIISISPFWMVGAEALLPGGERLHGPTIAGMAVGLVGAALLVTPDPGTHGIDRALLAGFLILQVGMVGWSFGSIYQRRKAGQRLAAGETGTLAGMIRHARVPILRQYIQKRQVKRFQGAPDCRSVSRPRVKPTRGHGSART